MDEDLAALHTAQQDLLAEAARGGFGAPQGPHWDAEQVLAHLIINERLLRSVTEDLLAGRRPDYDNAPSQDAFVLGSLIGNVGSLAGLVSLLGLECMVGRSALERLRADQRETMVHVRIWHEGNRIIDDPQPWWAFAVEASAGRHLPAHLEQLRALR